MDGPVRGKEETSSSNLRRLIWSIHIRKGRHRPPEIIRRRWSDTHHLHARTRPTTIPLPSGVYHPSTPKESREEWSLKTWFLGDETWLHQPRDKEASHCHWNQLPSRGSLFSSNYNGLFGKMKSFKDWEKSLFGAFQNTELIIACSAKMLPDGCPFFSKPAASSSRRGCKFYSSILTLSLENNYHNCHSFIYSS